MEYLVPLALGVIGFWVFWIGKRIGSARGFHFGRMRGRRDRRHRRF
jgi:hypothetical protein